MSSKKERGRRYDKKRRQSKPWRALYKTKQWQAMREQKLFDQPLCERCDAKGKMTIATVVHHIERHEGDENLFFCGQEGLASSCERCHNSDEQQIENRGYSTEVGSDGLPMDHNHPFNK